MQKPVPNLCIWQAEKAGHVRRNIPLGWWGPRRGSRRKRPLVFVPLCQALQEWTVSPPAQACMKLYEHQMQPVHSTWPSSGYSAPQQRSLRRKLEIHED